MAERHDKTQRLICSVLYKSFTITDQTEAMTGPMSNGPLSHRLVWPPRLGLAARAVKALGIETRDIGGKVRPINDIFEEVAAQTASYSTTV